AVLRDLEWLLNTSNIELDVDLEGTPEVRSSVLNYGMPNLSGKTISSVDIPHIERCIADAIKAFEPRILPNTIRVKTVAGAQVSHGNSVVFQIEGTLWGKPMPEVLFLRTELDLELGEVVLQEGDA
ncbi:MAG: type VI secretion system baseplate subunit TssE, partial [Pseudomonadota bacterium]